MQPSFENMYNTPAADAPRPLGRVSVIEAFKFVTSQPGWMSNVVFALLMMLVPVVGPIVFMGWQAEMIQRLVRRHPQPVPKVDLDDALHYLTRGLGPFVVSFVFQLVFFLIWYVVLGFGIGGAAIASETTGSDAATWGVAAVAGLIGIFVWAYGAALLNAAQTRAELVEDIGPSFAVGKIFQYANRTWIKHAGVAIVFGLLGLGMALLGMLVLFIGLYFAVAFLQLAAVHVRWQIYEWAIARGMEPVPVKAPQWLPSEAKRAQAEAWYRHWSEHQASHPTP